MIIISVSMYGTLEHNCLHAAMSFAFLFLKIVVNLTFFLVQNSYSLILSES